MKIVLEPQVLAYLETCVAMADGREVSGFGFVKLDRENNDFIVYDAVVLDIGSSGYTEIPSEKLLPLLDREDARNLKCWWHRHPIGSGVPGPHNWSGTDNNTARQEPLGSTPEMVKWSISIVRTPKGWVGRYDTYGPKGSLTHLEVEPSFAPKVFDTLQQLYIAKQETKLEQWRNMQRNMEPSQDDEWEYVDLDGSFDESGDEQMPEKLVWEYGQPHMAVPSRPNYLQRSFAELKQEEEHETFFGAVLTGFFNLFKE
jgi:hypothetical protein